MSGVDGADKAGGEVIFSSEGLDPIHIRPPDLPSSKTASEKDELTTEGMHAGAAFEVFAGKLYAPPGGNAKLSSNETPLERLARLQRETAELEEQVKSSNDPTDGALLATAVQTLQARLADTKLATQTDLSSNLSQVGSSTGNAPASTEQTEVGSAVVDRLQRLEAAIGSSTSDESLAKRLSGLEQMVATVDETKVEALHKKAKVIRQDLEAASKARNKLLQNSSKAEDLQTITALYDQMIALQGLVAHLPALSTRLATLSEIHQDQATWAVRLQDAEQTAQQLKATVSTVEETLSKLEEGMESNAKELETSLQALDKRLDGL